MARDGDEWTIAGDLTIKDTTRPVEIVFEHTGSAKDPFGNDRIGFEGAVTVSRKDWGLTWNAALETGGVLVSDKVKLEFDISGRQDRLISARQTLTRPFFTGGSASFGARLDNHRCACVGRGRTMRAMAGEGAPGASAELLSFLIADIRGYTVVHPVAGG